MTEQLEMYCRLESVAINGVDSSVDFVSVTNENYEEVYNIETHKHEEPAYKVLLTALVMKYNGCFIKMHGGKIVGLLTYKVIPGVKTVRLHNITVGVGHRSEWIGHAAIHALLNINGHISICAPMKTWSPEGEIFLKKVGFKLAVLPGNNFIAGGLYGEILLGTKDRWDDNGAVLQKNITTDPTPKQSYIFHPDGSISVGHFDVSSI